MEKAFNIELKTNKNNTYLITFTLGSDLKIDANQINDLIKKSHFPLNIPSMKLSKKIIISSYTIL